MVEVIPACKCTACKMRAQIMNDNRAKRTREILDQLSVVLTEYKNNLESSQCHQENCNYPRYYIIRKIELLNNDLKSIVRKVE